MDNQQTQDTTVMIDIDSFDAVRQSEGGYEIELKDPKGNGTGVFVTIVGKHAEVVTRWTARLINEAQREAMYAQKSGKQMQPKPIEELRARNIEGAALRVIGWRNVKQPFTQERMRSALSRNPHWIDQIVEESDDVGNFMKKQ